MEGLEGKASNAWERRPARNPVLSRSRQAAALTAPKTMPEPETLELIYRNALYWVGEAAFPASQAGDRWLLRVGQRQPLLLQAYAQHEVRCATYLTACNPHGRLLDAAENGHRMQSLREALRQKGWQWAEGFGQDPQDQWPGEASVLVWGMDRPMALAWGTQWQQNAVLFCGVDAVPELLWLR